ncbi:vitelline membrane protein Vm26Ab [Eurosta solidaginis]|uniref:vitelline membrane protein Vm26Ab n=1 Tax=Eurosta solidaginis TaxID=178769 RepID=UPI003531700B
MKFLICLALLFAVAQANPGVLAPFTYSAAAVPAYTTYAAAPYAAAPYAAAPYAAYSTYSAPAYTTYARAAYASPAVATYSHPVGPAVYSAPVVSTLLKKK